MRKEVKFFDALIPIITIVILLIFGLLIYPKIFEKGSISLEMIFITAAVFSSVNLVRLGYTFDEIQKSMVHKISQILPAVFILFSIGLIVGSWMISGTIPMLIYFGVDIIRPEFIFATGFLVTFIFSLFTGTSWGAAGTIGVVIMSIGTAIDANLSILAASIVGGAYLGDKLSPLSDTTNIAALAAGVSLNDHIRSMMNTTLPAGVITLIIYFILGFSTSQGIADISQVNALKDALSQVFNIITPLQIIILLIPVVVVVVGSLMKKPTVPTLICSVFSALIIGMLIQGYDLYQVTDAVINGFNLEKMTDSAVIKNLSSDSLLMTMTIVNRGGFYSMVSAVMICMSVSIFIGTLEIIDAIPRLVSKMFTRIKTKSVLIISTLAATTITNATTSNQFVTSFVVAETFKPKYKELKVSKKVLSRSLEDAGTMVENLLPWSTTGVYMATTLGVSPAEYAPFAFITYIGLIIAVILAITGKGCFYNQVEEEYRLDEEKEKYEK